MERKGPFSQPQWLTWKNPFRSLAGMKDKLRWIKTAANARAVSLFDQDLTNLYETSEESPEDFWSVFRTSACWRFDREAWHRELRSRGHDVRSECTCLVRHMIDGYLAHDRWILMILREVTAEEDDDFDAVLLLFLQNLPPKARIRRGSTGPLEARDGIPVWWVRGPR